MRARGGARRTRGEQKVPGDWGKSRGRGLREGEWWGDGSGQSQIPLVLVQNQLSRGEEGY